MVRVYSQGRPPPAEKAQFFRDARREVFELGISLRSLAGYFEQRPMHEFREHVRSLLQRGVSFRHLMLDPESEIARVYLRGVGEEGTLGNIQRSITTLGKVRDEFNVEGFAGRFEVWAYPRPPSCYLMLTDPSEPEGKALLSHYLPGVRRADLPVLEITKAADPGLFKTYWEFLQSLWGESRKL